MEFIRWLNERVASEEPSFFGAAPNPPPTLHVVGLPRSGTTLATQILARYTDLGYISNLAAVFGSAPATGIALQKLLRGRPTTGEMTSKFGKTDGIWEPHEFGYFWRDLLHYPPSSEHVEPDSNHNNIINWNRVRSKLSMITTAWGGPVMFKPVILCWHAARFATEVPNSCFIQIRRDPVQNAISLYEVRRKTKGVDTWFSLRPRTSRDLLQASPEEQVVEQVRLLQASIDDQFGAIPPERVLSIDYEEICADPERFLRLTQAKLRNVGGAMEVTMAAGAPTLHQRTRDMEKTVFRRIADLLENS